MILRYLNVCIQCLQQNTRLSSRTEQGFTTMMSLDNQIKYLTDFEARGLETIGEMLTGSTILDFGAGVTLTGIETFRLTLGVWGLIVANLV